MNHGVLLGTAVMTLLASSLPLIFLRSNLAYGLRDATPLQIDSAQAILSGEIEHDSFVSVPVRLDPQRYLVLRRYGIMVTYWYITSENRERLLVKRDPYQGQPFEPNRDGSMVTGRLLPLSSVPFSRDVRTHFAEQLGIEVTPNALVLSAGEDPAFYRALLPLYALVGLLWLTSATYIGARIAKRIRTRRSKSLPGL